MSFATAVTGFALTAGPASAAPATRYVAVAGNDDENNCLAKAAPCRSIQHAVDVADAGDIVSIGTGTFTESVQVREAITLQGDAAGGTVIRATDQQPSVLAGGEIAEGTVITLRDLDISGNASAPGVVALGAQLQIVNSHIDRNVGGVLGLASLVSLEASTASDNIGIDQNGSPAFGFGIGSLGGVVQIKRSTMAGNAYGGVVVANNIGPTLAAAAPAVDADSTVVDSTVSGNGQIGVASQGGSLDIDSSTISGNGSVGVFSAASAVTVRNSTVAATGNKILTGPGAPTTPAGVYNDTRSTTTDRVALRAAGLSSGTTKVAFGKRTISLQAKPQRRVAAAPVGITLSATALDQTGTVRDCVSALDGGFNSSADASNSCGFTTAKKDLVRTDAKLGPLTANGGPTKTHLPAADSPLLDKVPAAQSGTTDQRGVTRPQGARSDIGAVERQLAPVRITTKSLSDGQVGDSYRKALAATGGDGVYAWSLAKGSSLPDGLELSKAGVISGTPTESGKFTITVLADGASKRFTLVIDAAGAAPNGDGQDPIAETGAASASLMAWGTALLLAGFVVMLAAGHVGRRPGRHRT